MLLSMTNFLRAGAAQYTSLQEMASIVEGFERLLAA
jgi:hypothetical protein